IAAFAELRGIDQRALQAMLCRFGERIGDQGGWNDCEGKIDWFRDRREVGIDLPAPQLAALRIDQVHFHREAAIFKIIVDRLRPAPAAGVGCPDDRYGLGTQEVVDPSEHDVTAQLEYQSILLERPLPTFPE